MSLLSTRWYNTVGLWGRDCHVRDYAPGVEELKAFVQVSYCVCLTIVDNKDGSWVAPFVWYLMVLQTFGYRV